jgi:hypothetical protein
MNTIRVAILDGINVANVIVCDGSHVLAANEVEAPPHVGPGFAYIDGTFVEPALFIPWRISPLEFLGKFTESERIAAFSVAGQYPEFSAMLGELMAATEIVQNDDRLPIALSAFVQAGVITEDRVEEILS